MTELTDIQTLSLIMVFKDTDLMEKINQKVVECQAGLDSGDKASETIDLDLTSDYFVLASKFFKKNLFKNSSEDVNSLARMVFKQIDQIVTNNLQFLTRKYPIHNIKVAGGYVHFDFGNELKWYQKATQMIEDADDDICATYNDSRCILNIYTDKLFADSRTTIELGKAPWGIFTIKVINSNNMAQIRVKNADALGFIIKVESKIQKFVKWWNTNHPDEI